MKKTIITTAVIFFSMAGIADAAPDSNSIIRNGIEYYMQTDKAVYTLGENVEMLFRVSNLGDEDVIIGCSRSPEFNLLVQKDGETIWARAHWFKWFSPGVELLAGESIEIPHTWDMNDDYGKPVKPATYNVVGVMYNYGPTQVPVPITILPPPATTYYVDAAKGSDNNDGLSPQTALATIQKAINTAHNGDIVIVADGTYTGPGNRDINFLGKAITVRSESGPENCIIDCNAGRWDQHRGFYSHSGEDANSILTGFTIINGYHRLGGAISCRSSSPTITNCTIAGNTAEYYGGGMFNYGGSNPIVTNCFFINNKGGAGGGMCNYDESGGEGSNPTLTNCVFSGNYATHDGGGIYNLDSSLKIINCTINKNYAESSGGGICSLGESPTVTNCILWGNMAWPSLAVRAWQIVGPRPVLTYYSCIQDENPDDANIPCGGAANNNIDDDPCFVSPGYWADVNDPDIIVEPNDPNAVWVDGDYHLLLDSPCIDAGTDVNIYTDIEGNIRPFDFPGVDNNGDLPEFDMGAYEATAQEARLMLLPRVINRKSSKPRVMAWVHLPEDITKDQIDSDAPTLLYPGDIKAMRQFIFPNRRGTVGIFAFFDKAELMDAIPANGRVQLQVLGHLRWPGQYFYGTDTVRIIPRPSKHQRRRK